ncbi:hypothetical protein CRG98_021052 [Punica granatum]|uniref:Retroviral polymerase SH3-like domain-containing protein n=1 Tax=Punica granatum TaxID=22663 RepID=A0A2I0JQL7_PUNGR|nr:hypothetical protein CRG98_021052 [Punica granatum]
MSVMKYYSRLKTLWDELDNYLEIPTCTCSATRLYATQREREKTHQFLMGLGSEFMTMWSNILSHEPSRSLNKVYALILHEERQNIVTQSHENAAPDGAVFLSKITGKQGSGGRQTYSGQGGGKVSGATNKTCFHCGRVGYIKSRCWLLHGFSANLESKQVFERGGGTGKGLALGKRGGGTGMAGGHCRPGQNSGQHNGLGCHAFRSQHFRNYSISSVPMMTTCLVIADCTTRKTIGVGELQGGVYHLRHVTIQEQANRVISDETDDLWHMRLGHPSRRIKLNGGTSTEFCGECATTAAHLINITPTPILGGKSPYEVLFDKPPNYSNLRVFGCLCYAYDRPRDKDKFKPRSCRCIFIGYPYGKKAWRVYDLEKNEIFVSRDVRFCEREFQFSEHMDNSGRKDTSCIRFF